MLDESPLKSIRIFLFKVETILKEKEVAFLSPSKICENLNLSTEIQILLGDKNATYLCSKTISTLLQAIVLRTCLHIKLILSYWKFA